MKHLLLLSAIFAVLPASASDWPVYGRDNARTFHSPDVLPVPLGTAWVYRVRCAPRPAFRGMLASRWNFIAEPMQIDYAYHPVICSGRVVIATYAEEAVVCLDAADGATNWIHSTEGAVRVPPAIYSDKVYFGADDGYVTCLNLADGTLVWRYRCAPETRRIMVNERMGSQWPVRTGVTVSDGIAYFGCGLFTQLGAYLGAVDADNAALHWLRPGDYSFNGPLYIDGAEIVAPSGRASPSEWRRSDGTCLMPDHSGRRQGGGAFVGTCDGMLVYGPMETGYLKLRVRDDGTDNGYQSIDGRFTAFQGEELIADSARVYLMRTNAVMAYDRAAFSNAVEDSIARGTTRGSWQSDNRFIEHYEDDDTLNTWLDTAHLWSVTVPFSQRLCAIAVASNALVAGGNNYVRIYNPADGTLLWSAPVEGEVHALAIADGALYAGTSLGHIYCFRANPGTPTVWQPAIGNPFSPDPVISEAAALAVANADRTQGVAFVLGAGADAGQLMYELAVTSAFYIVGVEDDTNKAELARANLRRAGLYGERATVHLCPPGQYPYPDYLANLVMSAETLATGALPGVPANVMRIVQPFGGTLLLGTRSGALDLSSWSHSEFSNWTVPVGPTSVFWRVAHRGDLTGAGAWTHQFGDVANTACSRDALVETNLVLQWFGRPGSEDVFDRHYMPMSPLFANGLMIVGGKFNTLKGLDPYNGTLLWQVGVPSSARQNMPLSGGFMCMDTRHVYICSAGDCRKIDAKSGAHDSTFSVPSPGDTWGFIATADGLVYGSWGRAQATYNSYYDPNQLINQQFDTARPIVSKGLFAVVSSNGASAWTYDTNSVIINQSIVIGKDRVFFAESFSPLAVADSDGCVDLREFFATNAWLVALDRFTGAELWRSPLERLNPAADGCEHIMYLSYAEPEDVLVATRTYLENVSGNYYVRYRLSALEPVSGSNLWEKTIIIGKSWLNTIKSTKSQATCHPNIVNGRLYLLPFNQANPGTMFGYDVRTGAECHDTSFGTQWERKGCAMRTASASAMFHRHTVMEGYHIPTRRKWYVSRVTRPSCWQSVVPAGGLLLMPEGGSECVCGISLQLSAVMAPAGQETTPPALVGIAVDTPSNLTVHFSEPVSAASAAVPSHYAIDGGVTVLTAARDTTANADVNLTTSPMSNGSYTLSVHGVTDLVGNVIPSNSAVMFVVSDVAIELSTNELCIVEGSTGDFGVWLSAPPVSVVTVTVARASGDTDLSVAAGASHVFSSADYSAPRAITIAAAEDDDKVNGQAVFQCSAPGLNARNFTANERDNDVGGATNGIMVLRQGLNGYVGVKDTYLHGAFTNYNYGQNAQLWTRDHISVKRHALLKWDLSVVPPDVIVTGVTLTFNVLMGEQPLSASVHALKRAWVEGSGTGSATGDGATYGTTDGSTPWEQYGARGPNDMDATVLGTFSVSSTGATMAVLSTQGVALVQSWIGHSELNHGFIIPGPDGSMTRLHSSQASDGAVRPTMTILYTEPPDGPQNPSVLINNDDLFTTDPHVTLALHADPPAPVEMLVSESPYFTGATLIPYQTNMPWTLPNELAVHTVYAQFFDTEGDPSDVASDSIELVPEPLAALPLCATIYALLRAHNQT